MFGVKIFNPIPYFFLFKRIWFHSFSKFLLVLILLLHHLLVVTQMVNHLHLDINHYVFRYILNFCAFLLSFCNFITLSFTYTWKLNIQFRRFSNHKLYLTSFIWSLLLGLIYIVSWWNNSNLSLNSFKSCQFEPKNV